MNSVVAWIAVLSLTCSAIAALLQWFWDTVRFGALWTGKGYDGMASTLVVPTHCIEFVCPRCGETVQIPAVQGELEEREFGSTTLALRTVYAPTLQAQANKHLMGCFKHEGN